ncbi:MAG: GNAT family N-acetyltransferase [Acidimicrobiales bacterium]
MSDEPQVIDHPEAEHPWLGLAIDGHTGVLQYHLEDDRLVLDHTEVPEELGGQGVGGRLVEAAVSWAEADGLTVVPHCPFARSWLQNHPDAAARVLVDWPPATD